MATGRRGAGLDQAPQAIVKLAEVTVVVLSTAGAIDLDAGTLRCRPEHETV